MVEFGGIFLSEDDLMFEDRDLSFELCVLVVFVEECFL